MTCHDIQHQLYPFLDGELENALSDAVRHHLASCAPCRGLLEATKHLEDQLRTTFRDESVPAALWPRIQADLGRGISNDSAELKRPGMGPWMWPAVAAAVLVLALSIGLFRLQLSPASLQARQLSVPVQDLHTFVASQRPLDVDSTVPERVRQWFRQKVDFSPPLLPVRAGQAQLVGGRLCHFLNRRVAAFMYTADDHFLSVYVMPRRGLPLPAGGDGVLEPLRATVYDVQGYTHIIWSKTDLVYSLVSDLSQAQLVDVAKSFGQTS